MQYTCTVSGTSFILTDTETQHRERVAPAFGGVRYDFPSPLLCPEERLRRRLAFRNERTLFRRKCSMTGKEIISIYAPDAPFVVVDTALWWGDTWDGLSSGRPFDPSRPFFAQWQELQRRIPRMAVLQSQNENSPFTNCVSNLKDCHLLASSDFDRDCYYGTWIEHCNDCVDGYILDHCEYCYRCVFSQKCYNCIENIFCVQNRDSAFLFDCHGCKDCFCCTNLRNKSFCFENRQCTKEEYEQLRAGVDLGDSATYHTWRTAFAMRVEQHAIHPPVWKRGHFEHSTGDCIADTENCQNCFDIVAGKDCMHCLGGYELTDAVDCCYGNASLGYENCECFPLPYRSAFNVNCYGGGDLYYCDHCMNTCKNCFGCVGLKHKEYCVLNVQYTKEEYEALVPQIIEHMRQTGEYGEFFPMPLSPFAYNESEAQDVFPLTKENTMERGLLWRDPTDDVRDVAKQIRAEELPQNIDATPDDILSWAILCDVSRRPFKITRRELALYRSLHVPLPHRHPNVRMLEQKHARNPYRLFPRNCAKCGEAIQTTYSPERPEIVYCEQCYLQAVY